MPDAPETVLPTDQLSVPFRKRMSKAYVTSDAGARELCIYYGVKEVSFDEEHLFPFGEQLVRQGAFVARDATTWGPGYSWEELQPLLEALLSEGVLKRGELTDDPRGGGLVASPLPASSCPAPRAWSAGEIESITTDLGGRPIEIGNIEAILSVYRIPHPALDADLRQVGEANVWPPSLRLDRDTEWRVCQYSGSRYRDDRPMNVTALKAMIKHWKPMMSAILEIRAETKPRLTRSREAWTVSDMHLLSGIILSVPAYMLMKRGGTTPQPPVHPVLSSMFRISDGIRMVTHQMLFLSDERTRMPDEVVTAEDLYGFSERNGTFLQGAGVCAGPKAMIDELLTTVFSGVPSERVDGTAPPSGGADVRGHAPGVGTVTQDPQVRALLDELPAAVDYGFLGLMSWSVVRSVWLGMSIVYKGLRELFTGPVGESAIGVKLRGRLEDHWYKLDAAKIATDYERDVHLQVYVDTYEQSRLALRSPVGAATLAERITAVAERPEHVAVAEQLRAILTDRFAGVALGDVPVIDRTASPSGDADGQGHAPAVERMVELFVYYLREEQAVLASTTEIQGQINALLERAQPTRPLTARDLRLTYAMYGGFIAKFPYLFDMLEEEFGFHVSCTADAIELIDQRTRAA